MKICDLINYGYEQLKSSNIESPLLDSQVILAHLLKKDKMWLIINKNGEADCFFEFEKLIERRKKHEPVAYITGKCEFMSLDFSVNESTLIPRPDTEILVEKAIEYVNNTEKTIIDFGTGSGCIIISILNYCKNAKGIAVDISENALKTAMENAKNNNISNVNFIKMDILNDFPNVKVDMVISNPPYIRKEVIEELETDVKDYEPYQALYGGFDGLVFYRRIAEKSKEILNKNGKIMLEIGYDQAYDVMKILKENNYKNIELFKDYGNRDRVVVGEIAF